MNLDEAKKEWFNKPENARLKSRLEGRGITLSQISPGSLPSFYDNTPLGGVVMVDGIACHTVGEHKAAYAKKCPY